MKGNVRFQATPVILNHPESSLDDSTSSNNSNLDLLKALKLDEHSSPGDAPLDRTVFDDSVYNRDHFAGRTPHSKVVEAKKERRALQELMKVPVFAQNHQKEDLSLLQKDPNHNNLSKNKVEIQSNFLASTNSVRSVLNESSYHFDLMLQPVQDEDENKHPQVVSISLSKGSNGVHFDEENLVQNRLTTPSASRKIPIRKTPAPSQNFSPQEMQSTHSKVLGKELIQDGSIKKNEIPFEEVSNSSMEISSISPAHYQANFVSSMASTSSASPLASLISRPEVSKSSPIIACSPKKVVDVATSYSPPSILPAHDTFAASKKDATTSYSYSTNLVNDSQSVLISPDRVQSNPIDKRMTSDASNRQQLITESPSHYSPTWGLIKQGGVSFGRGPIFSNIAHNVASIKQGVHHVVSTVTELPVLPKVNDHPNLISSSLTTSTFSTSAELAEVNLPRPVDEADRIKPAIDWFSPRHTRKPVPLQPTQFQFPQSHHLPLNHSSTESFIEHSTSSNHVSQSTQLRQVRVDKPMIMKSEALKAAQICDVSVQVDSTMLKSNQTQEISTNISQESNLDNSYSLEELMQSATSTIMQENVTDTCSTYQQRHHLEKSARPPFDFTSCNIGGTPSTINTKFMTKTNSNSQCTSASSAYSTSLSYTTIPSLHSVDDGYKRSANIMPSSLGKPVRVPLTIEKEEYIEAVWGNEEEEFIANYNYGDHSHAEETLEDMNRDLTVNEKINQYQNLSNPDLTILTDIAIAHFTRDQQLEQDQYDDDLSIPTNSTSFFSNGMETTMTLDHSFMVKQSYPNVSESVTAPYPRLAIRSLKRDADNAFDIKELGFETSPNELMTIMLTLKNDQRNGKTIKLISKTIFLRVEPLYCQRQTENPKNSMEEYFHEDEKNSIFTVSPDVLEIPSQDEGMIFITFAPKKEGIYSGAVKITYRKKHFTLLLRGECSSQYACEKLGFANNNQLLASAEKTSAQMVPCHAFPSSHPYQSSPETLQSIPPTHSKVDRICFTSPIDNLQSNETPDMRSSADWKEVVSPGTFQNKLRFLQKKIGEISRKITLKDTVHTKSIFHKPAMALTVPPLVQGDPKIFYNNKKKEEIFLLQSNPSSEQSTANSKFASSFNYQADTERTAIKRHISKNMENSSMSSLNGIAISSPNNKVWKGANYYSQEYQSSNSIVPAQANSVVLEEQQFAIRTERDKLTQKQVVSTSFSEHSKSRDDKAEIVVTDNNDEYLLNPTKRKGLFFRKEVERFGYTMIGSLVRTKIVLCNASNHEITVFFGDVQPPFYNHHNEVKMRAKSFVRVPVRFVPTSAGEFQQELIAQTADGKFQAVVRLVGTASSATPYKA